MALKSFVTATDAIFTVANTDSQVIGSSLLNQTVRIQDKGNLASGVMVDANIERIELFGALSNYEFITDATLGFQIRTVSNSTVVATLGSANQNVAIVFTGGSGGSATLVQNGSGFTLNTVSIGSTVVAASAITLTTSSPTSTVAYDLNGTAVTPADANLVSKSFVTEANDIFTVADHDVNVLAGAGNQTVRIQAGVTGVKLDANIERIELSGALATYKFLATTNIGLRIYESNGSTLVATIPNINQAVKIAFTDGSATLMQTGAIAFTLGTQAVITGDAAGALTPTLVTTTGERSVLGLHVTSGTTAGDIPTVFGQYIPTSGTSDTAATVVADGMSPSQLNAVAAKVSQIAEGGITGVMALTSGQTSTQLTALFSKDDGVANATVTAIGATTGAVAVLASNVGKIIDNGITGAISLSGTEFGTLTAKIAGGTAATLTVTDTSLAATVLTAMDTKSDNAVNAANLTTITGLTAEVKAVTDTLATIVVGTVTDGVSNAAATLSDTAGTALAATNLSAIGAKTSGIVTVTNAVVIEGTTAAVTAALVTTETLVVAGTALVTLNDTAFNASSNNVTVAATALSAIGGKTGGVVTVTNAVKIVGNTAEVTAALVTDPTLVVAGTALVTTSNAGSVGDVNAILGKTSGIVTAAVTADTASTLNTTLTSTGGTTGATATDALTLTLNDTTGVTITLLNSLNDKTSVNVGATSLTEVLGITSGGIDTIDLNAAGITYHDTALISIKGGVGDDVLTGRANAPDTFVIGNTGADGQIITINNFNGTNDILSFFTDAILNVKMDSDDADGTQEIQATSFSNTGNATFTVKLMGLTNAQDASLFNMASFNTLFAKTGRDGNDVIVGTGSNDTITGGLGVDAMTGNGGNNTFVFGLATTTPTAMTDVITDFVSGTDIISFAAAVTAPAFDSSALKASDDAGFTANVNVSVGGVATFHGDDTTVAEKVVALQEDTATNAIGKVTLFVDGADSYIFSAGASTATTDDQVIKLANVTATGFTISGSTITSVVTAPDAVDLSATASTQATAEITVNATEAAAGKSIAGAVQAPTATDITQIKIVLAGAGLDKTGASATDQLVLEAAQSLDADLTGRDVAINSIAGLDYAFTNSTTTLLISKNGGGALTAADVDNIVSGILFKTAQADGVRTATVSYVDALGQEGTAGVSTITVDKTAPTVTAVSVASASTITATSNEAGTLGVYTDDTGTTLVGSAATLTAGAANTVMTVAEQASTAITAGKLIVKDAAGNMTVQAGVVQLGVVGVDTFTHATVDTANYIFGFGGTDILSTADASIADADFVNIRTVETLTLTTSEAKAVELGTNATAAGIVTVNADVLADGVALTLTGDADGMTVTLVAGDLAASAFTGDLTVTATTGTNVIATGSGADIVTGGTSADTIDVGAGLDTVIIAAGDSTVTVSQGDNTHASTVTGFDAITGLAASITDTVDSETLDVAGTAALYATGSHVDSADITTYTNASAANVVFKSHIAAGIVTFYSTDDSTTVITLSAANMAGAVAMLAATDLGDAGATAAFIVGTDTFVYTQAGADAGTYDLVQLVGVAADSLVTANGHADANNLFIM